VVHAKWLDGVAEMIRRGRNTWIPYATNADLCVFKEEMRRRNITILPRHEAMDRPGIGLVLIAKEGA